MQDLVLGVDTDHRGLDQDLRVSVRVAIWTGGKKFGVFSLLIACWLLFLASWAFLSRSSERASCELSTEVQRARERMRRGGEEWFLGDFGVRFDH